MPTIQAIRGGSDAPAAGPAGLAELLKKHDIKSLGNEGEIPGFEGFLAENASCDDAPGSVETAYAEQVDVSEMDASESEDTPDVEEDTSEDAPVEDGANEEVAEDLFVDDIAVPTTDIETPAPQVENEMPEGELQATQAGDVPVTVEETGVPGEQATTIAEEPRPEAAPDTPEPTAADPATAIPKEAPKIPVEAPVPEKAAKTAGPAEKHSSADTLPPESKPQGGAEVKLPEAAAHDEPVRQRPAFEDPTESPDASTAQDRAKQAAQANPSWNAPAGGQAVRRETIPPETVTARPEQGGDQGGARGGPNIAPASARMELFQTTAEQPVAGARRMTPMNETLFVDTMLRQARLIERPNGDADMTIALKPDELGSVTIRLSLRQDRLTAEVNVQNEDARVAMTDVVQRVKQALAEDGLELDEFSIGLRREWRQHANRESRDENPASDRGAAGSGENNIESAGPEARVRALRQASATGTMDFVA